MIGKRERFKVFFQDRLIVLLGGRDRTVEMGFKKLGFLGFYKKN